MQVSEVQQEDFVAEVDRQITRAYELAERGDVAGAVELFGEIRDFGERPQLKPLVDKLENGFRASVSAERDKFRTFIREGNPSDPERRIVILADSLGLPRPEHPNDILNGLPTSYAFALREAVARRAAEEGAPATAIDPLCQRYATTDRVLENMALAQLDGADLIIHVGLNDFSRRIFMERQRLALKLLPNALVNRIVKFSQVNMYRADLIRHFSEFCYVPLDKWVANIQSIIDKANAAGARSLTWFTIVQLPMTVESHTPNYRYNVTRYNLALYEAARRGDIQLLDADRMFWDHGYKAHMHSDLMHLSPKGHVSICNRMIERLFDVKAYRVHE
ncbi:SGNH/GDSL hydrolase family protein [Arvimicrobium flavum]|uniref:SGNH/GDSL hydrolase family protein n=1 Tax=Arvimicrobium flavum TaxID=3393320 RepID=UPI00237BC800|nr:SGNH/GDSL hydrolase family protein [Mesorhizobium shangrilense]